MLYDVKIINDYEKHDIVDCMEDTYSGNHVIEINNGNELEFGDIALILMGEDLEVVLIKKKMLFNSSSNKIVKSQLLARVEKKNFVDIVEKEMKRAKLEKMLEEKYNNKSKLMIYEKMAEEDSEMKKLLDEYKALDEQ